MCIWWLEVVKAIKNLLTQRLMKPNTEITDKNRI